MLTIRLNQLNYDLGEYRSNLRSVETAKTELEKLRKQYENEFIATTSHIQKILAIDSLGLIGVEKIQDGINTAYRGKKERNLTNSMTSVLQNIQRKITSEEDKISRCQKSISNTKDEIDRLEKQLMIG
jgi:peptidoglycan hydrolase CwlO-like protein